MRDETAFDAASLVTSAETAAGFGQMGILWTLLISGESTRGAYSAPPAHAAYAATKGAVEAMTLIVARELRDRDFLAWAFGGDRREGSRCRSTPGALEAVLAIVARSEAGGGRGKTIISFT